MKGTATVRFSWSSEPGRPQEEKTLENFLKEAAEAGYDAVENYEEGMGDALKRHGLKIAGAYVGVTAHESWEAVDPEGKVAAVARGAAELGADHLAVNCSRKGSWGDPQRKTDDEVRRQGEHLTRLAQQFAPLGLALVMHNHADRSDLHLDDLLSVTAHAGDDVGILLDTGWAMTSQDDPVARIRDLGPRVRALHLRNQVGAQPTEWLGEGDMDMADCIRALKEIGYAGWLTTELWYPKGTVPTRSHLANQTRTVALLGRLWREVQ